LVTHSTKLNGPVPTGCSPYWAPHFRTAVGDEMKPGPSVNQASSGVNGPVRSRATAEGLTTRTALMDARPARNAEPFAGLRIRSMLNLTAAASNGVPSWNRTPRCSCNVTRVPSGETVQLLTSPGVMAKAGSRASSGL